MKKSTSIILLAVVIILFIAPLVMYNGYGEDEGYFGGADDQAGEAIEETGYEPWFSSISVSYTHLTLPTKRIV